MIHPLLLHRQLRVGEDAVTGGSGEGVTCPAAAAFYVVLIIVGLAFDRDTDGCEALGVPFLDPFLVGRTTAPVDEDDARDLAFAFSG
jgi:hypothetical protein